MFEDILGKKETDNCQQCPWKQPDKMDAECVYYIESKVRVDTCIHKTKDNFCLYSKFIDWII